MGVSVSLILVAIGAVLVWATTFTAIALSHFVATTFRAPEAVTVFNWVLPIALAAIAAHRSRICWDNFNDEEMFERDPIGDLAIDFGAPPLHSTDH